MKSSKIENIFNYQPPLEDSKSLSPLTYCQPFQPSFEPEFSASQPKYTPWQNPPQIKRWSQGTERSSTNLQMSGGEILSPWDNDNRGFGPEPSTYAKSSFPGTSVSAWGEVEGRSLCNSTWSNPGPSRPSYSACDEGRGSTYFMSGMGGLGMHSRFPQKSDASVSPMDSRFASPNGPPFRTESSIVRSIGRSTSFGGNLSQSTYYPLMLGPLGKNIGQNVYKTGHNRPMVCNFCKNNKEVPDIYMNHYLHDPETKVLSCPVLRKHVCEICGGTGDQAHTLQYCPVNRERGFQSKVPVLLKTRTITNSTGKIRRN